MDEWMDGWMDRDRWIDGSKYILNFVTAVFENFKIGSYF